MIFKQSVKTCFRKYFTFSGRASRSEYWWFFMFGILAHLVAGVFDGALFDSVTLESQVTETSASFRAENTGPIGALLLLALLIPTISVGWRRMHDSGRSGLYLLYPLILMVGLGMFLAVFGSSGASETGDLGGPVALIAMLAIIVLVISPFIVLFWLIRPSQPGPNEYGPNPHEVTP